MTQSNRLNQGGRIDRSRRLSFIFNGQQYTGFAGDTLASALANGVDIVNRSFKYSRPAGSPPPGRKSPMPSSSSAPAKPLRFPTCVPPSRRCMTAWWHAVPTAGRTCSAMS